MIQWHLFNKWGAIFAEVPPLKYLKLITLYVHAGCIHWSVGKPLDTGEQQEGLVTMDDTEDSYKANEMVQGWVNWWPFPVCPFHCILLAVSWCGDSHLSNPHHCLNTCRAVSQSTEHSDIPIYLYKLNWQCSNNQAEQLAILKALDYIQHMKIEEREVLLSTDSQITLDLLQNRKKHTYLIEKIRTKVTEMERDWQVKFNWIKAHAGHHGNEMADQLAKEAANSKRINEGYNRIPKSAVKCELNKQSITQWQNEWDRTTKVATTNSFFP